MSEKWRQSEICIAINDISQGSKPSIDDLLYYKFITQSPGKIIFQIGEHLVKLQAKR